MRLWDLPGARCFVDATCELLRDGNSVVVRFPQKFPEGFDIAVEIALGNVLKVSHLKVTASPLKDLANRYAEHPGHISRLQDLCDDPGFRGRLVWLDGPDVCTWPAWCDFLVAYAEVSRLRPLFDRSLFLVLLTGSPPPDAPPADIGLATLEWDGVLDDVDLLLYATQRLRVREGNPLLRSLLATTIAHVAAWDFDTAAALSTANNYTILNPGDLLRTIAHEKGWQAHTPPDWRLGTASRTGIVHPARAALDDPPFDLNHRLWSAQLSVLLPPIEAHRHDTISTNLFEVKQLMRANGNGQKDPFKLELRKLVELFNRPGASPQALKTFRRLLKVRNKLAHRRHVAYSSLIDLIELLPS